MAANGRLRSFGRHRCYDACLPRQRSPPPTSSSPPPTADGASSTATTPSFSIVEVVDVISYAPHSAFFASLSRPASQQTTITARSPRQPTSSKLLLLVSWLPAQQQRHHSPSSLCYRTHISPFASYNTSSSSRRGLYGAIPSCDELQY